jgi:hypothetical protein
MRCSALPLLGAVALTLVASVTLPVGDAPGDGDAGDELQNENEQLQARIRALEDELREEVAFSYVVVKGFISDAEMIYMETMDIDSGKQYCNSNPRCKGFTFGGSDERPEDEVTLSFKAGSKVEAASDWISYVKEESMFGGLHGARGAGLNELHEASSPTVVTHALTFELICIVLALSLCVVFWRFRRRK